MRLIYLKIRNYWKNEQACEYQHELPGNETMTVQEYNKLKVDLEKYYGCTSRDIIICNIMYLAD